ncbi:MAG: hypothetical protein ISR73_13970 [Gammaproteobacteria bacterium]|nr:hypothetical protein [Gammaproteobacteria bacterium]
MAPRTLVIDPGSNGVLDSIQSDGDEQEFVTGYELQRTCSVASTDTRLVGQYCSADTTACSCNGPSGLVRVNTFRNGDYGANWFARVEGDLPTSVDFDKIVLKAGQSIRLAFLQDLDKDGLFAHEEFLFGSVDSAVDQYDNDEFVPIVINNRYLKKTPEQYTYLANGDGLPDSMDSDRDGISDLVEAKLGWLISRNGELKRVFSSPATADSDNDGLWDIQEQDLREFCKTDDPRNDALCIAQTVAQADASAIIVGKNGRLDTLASGDDVYAFVTLKDDNNDGVPDDNSFNRNLMFATVGILPGANGVIDTVIANGGLDEYSNSSLILPATDPLLNDTDADRVSDGVELFGYAAGMAIIEAAETECNYTEVANNKGCDASAVKWGIVDTVAQGDDVQRIFPGSRTKLGDVIITAGLNGILETQPQGNDATVADWYLAAGPDRRLNSIDLASYVYEANPAGNIVVYATGNQLLDPYAPAVWNSAGSPVGLDPAKYVEPWLPVASGLDIKLYGHVVTTDPLRRDTDRDAIPDGFEVAIGADPTVDDGDQFRDSDFDGLSDRQEAQGWIVSIDNSTGVLVRPSSIVPDSDYDGLPDYVERDIGSNPNKADTDSDGLSDYDEFRSVIREAMNGRKYQFSVFDYANLAQLFSGFNLVINPDAHNTDPVLKDSDGDNMSDFNEVVTGYTVTLVGELFKGDVILTDPNNADSDGDGITDYDEATGASGYITNANNADTDGDGTSDGTEVASGGLINPLVQDALVTVNYESLYLANLDSCSQGGGLVDADGNQIPCPTSTNVLWWLYANGNDGVESGNHLISSSDEFAYTPEGTVRPSAAGHSSLVTSDFSFGNKLLTSTELPGSAAAVYGLRMQAKECPHDTLRDEIGCTPDFNVEAGDTGFSLNANINFGNGGFDGLVDNFVATWTGEIYILATGDYEFFITSDDGTRLFIDGASVLTKLGGNTATDDEIWGDHGTTEASGEVIAMTAGWHRIVVKVFDQGGPSNISLKWITPYQPEKQVISPFFLKRPLGNGSYACIGVERDPTQSSFISLNREIERENTLEPVQTYLPDLPYYGSITGSELKLFRDVVALDDGYTNNVPTHLPNSRLYLDGSGKPVKTLMSMALDLSASRKIIDNLVRSDVDNQSIINSAVLSTDENGDRYFTLSTAGRMLYQQLKANQTYGQQRFVVRKGESIQLSGVLMKVDDQESLTSCPIGSAGAVSQFKSGCTKRFSRSLSFAEVTQQGYVTFDLNSLLAQTYTSDGNPAGCDIDLNVILSR